MEHAAAAALVGSRTDGHALSAWVLGRVGGPSGTGLKPHVVSGDLWRHILCPPGSRGGQSRVLIR